MTALKVGVLRRAQARWMVNVGAGLLTLSGVAAHAQTGLQALPELNIDAGSIGVSGFSSGGFMAVQLHVANSGSFSAGAGIVAGGPYNCAENSADNANGRCMAHQSSIPVADLVDTTRAWSADGSIDPVDHLQDGKLYLFGGKLDSVVAPGVMDELQSYYSNLMPAGSIVYKNDVSAQHAFATDDYGNACWTFLPPAINNCGFDLAGAILNQLHGPLLPRNNGALTGNYIQFDQRAFVGSHGLADKGWAYVPQRCAAGESCRLHVVVHGCLQRTVDVGQQYVRNTGYSRWADSNNIVLLFPQTGVSAPNGCWDWWGYDSADYAKKAAPQMQAIMAMVDHLSGGYDTASLAAPASVNASAATDTSMTLSWNAVPGASEYRVYRNGGRVADVRANTRSFVDTDLATGTNYTWTVRAINSHAERGALSASVSATTLGSAPVCGVSTNLGHAAAGRAYFANGMTYAVGSNDPLGPWSSTGNSVLRQVATGNWRIGACN